MQRWLRKTKPAGQRKDDSKGSPKQPNSPLSNPNSPYNLTTAKALPSHFRHRRPIPRLNISVKRHPYPSRAYQTPDHCRCLEPIRPWAKGLRAALSLLRVSRPRSNFRGAQRWHHWWTNPGRGHRQHYGRTDPGRQTGTLALPCRSSCNISHSGCNRTTTIIEGTHSTFEWPFFLLA